MRTDAHLNVLFSNYPNEFFELFGLPSPGACLMKSVTVKEISRTLDGLMEPADAEQPMTLLEFQMQLDPHILRREAIELACLEIALHPRKIHAYAVFGTESLNPQTPPWDQVVTALYLDTAVEKLATQQPNHWLVALFRPILEQNDEVVEKMARTDYATLQQVAPSHSGTTKLPSIFLDWISQRFKFYTSTQISKMIAQLTPIEQTALGKELIGKGMEKGMAKGMEVGMERVVIKQVTKKFGPVSADVKAKIEALPMNHLEAFAEDLLGLNSIVEVEAWLLQFAAK